MVEWWMEKIGIETSQELKSWRFKLIFNLIFDSAYNPWMKIHTVHIKRYAHMLLGIIFSPERISLLSVSLLRRLFRI